MRPLPLLAILVLGLAGCATPSSTTTTTTGMDHEHMHMMMAKTVDVAMKGDKFVNDTVTIYQGDTVRWTHMDGMTTPHNVVADDGSFDSNPNCASTIPIGVPASQVCMVGGQTYMHTFDKVGTVTYKCRVHANMKGTVVVRAHDASMTM